MLSINAINMKILFVCSGNSKNGLSSIIKNQGESLKKYGLEVDYYTIKGKGLLGYCRNIFPLRKYIKKNTFSIVHAHYSLSAFVASFAGIKPLVASLMGSDVKSKQFYRFIIKFFHRFFWTKTIVKTEDMQNSLQMKDILVIPNGVDLSKFKPLIKEIALKETGWDTSMSHVLFAANPNRPEKNFELTKKAFELLNNQKLVLHYLKNVPNNKMVYYYNASDVILLSSLWEGSPNVIKEAMACNISIVSTRIGDVEMLLSGVEGCYIAEFDPEDYAIKLHQAIKYSCLNGRTKSRKKITELGLDDQSVAKKIIDVYNDILPK